MMRQLPDSLTLSTPPEWMEFPVEADDHAAFRKELDDRLREEGAELAVRRSTELFLRNVEVLASSQNVVLSSGVIGAVDDDVETPVFASVVVSTLSRDALGTDVPLMPGVVLAAFARESDDPAKGLSYAHLEPPAEVMIADCEAVRLRRLMTVTRPGEEDHAAYTESYVVPVADGDGLVNVQFMTTAVNLAREFSELFASMANTLRVIYPDEPTVEPALSDG